MNARATFVRMQDSTREDWQLIGGEFMQFATGLPERRDSATRFHNTPLRSRSVAVLSLTDPAP